MRTPKKLTLGEAAKTSGWSKTTIHKALKSGKMSGDQLDSGQWEIDPAELNRVFPSKHSGNDQVVGSITPDLHIENTRLQGELNAVIAENTQLKERVQDLKEAMRLLPAPEKREQRVYKLFGVLPIAWS